MVQHTQYQHFTNFMLRLHHLVGFTYPVGNENLQPETTRIVRYHGIAYKDFAITYFNNKIDNLIEYTNGYNNVEGTSNIDGIEIAYSKEIIADLQVKHELH